MPAARRRRVLLLAAWLPALGGCAPFNNAVGSWAGIDTVVAIPVFGRTMSDLAYSLIAGRDCSVVRLEQSQAYCKPREDPPPPPEFCTRSLGTPDCWASPALLPDHPQPLADAPALTPAQQANRTARWPDL